MKASDLRPFYHKTFRVEELQNFFREPPSTIKAQLWRLCKNKKLIRLKRNCYTFPDFHPNVYIMAQEMVAPSYFSLESVLSWNGVIPEGTVAYTLITSKKTQEYSNTFGHFLYRHLSPDLFFGVKKRSDGAWIAEIEKALLDYLYLNSQRLKPDFACWQAERFDLEGIHWKKMKTWAKKYGMKKLVLLVKNLEEYFRSDAYQMHR